MVSMTLSAVKPLILDSRLKVQTLPYDMAQRSIEATERLLPKVGSIVNSKYSLLVMDSASVVAVKLAPVSELSEK